MMLQQIMTAPGKIEFREVPVPKPGEGQVLIKILRFRYPCVSRGASLYFLPGNPGP